MHNSASAAASQRFDAVLVPYDGSEPSRSALALALTIVSPAGRLIIVTVVDETTVIAESASSVMGYDPTPLFEDLDRQGKAVLAEAVTAAAAATRAPLTELVHDVPVRAILDMVDSYRPDLIVMGTHARTGVSRMFIGSTTEGVLRATTTPVLTVRATDARETHPFATALLGIDDSDASDAAVGIAARLAHAYATKLFACTVIDLSPIYANAGSFPFDPTHTLAAMRADGEAVIARAMQRADLDTATATVVEGKPAAALLEAAQRDAATVIIVGSHGRRGLQRFILGSVAEDVVRSSDVPVLVVRVST